MASMFIRHRVADYAAWKSMFDQHETTRREFGFTVHSLHRDADDLRSTMERAGVQGPPEIWLAEDIEG